MRVPPAPPRREGPSAGPGGERSTGPAGESEGPVAAAARRILREVAGTEEVLRDPDLALYGSGLLDSLATVGLMAALAEELGIEVSPAEFDAAAWATPRRFVADVCARSAGGPRP